MAYGTVEYNSEGNPICELCGKGFRKVISHVWQHHEMTGKEYKQMFGFDSKKGIVNRELAETLRQNVLNHYDDVIIPLIENGKKSRYKQGQEGRTKDKVSEQTRKALVEHCRTEKMRNASKKNGHKLGKSGLGNKARWEQRKAQ